MCINFTKSPRACMDGEDFGTEPGHPSLPSAIVHPSSAKSSSFWEPARRSQDSCLQVFFYPCKFLQLAADLQECDGLSSLLSIIIPVHLLCALRNRAASKEVTPFQRQGTRSQLRETLSGRWMATKSLFFCQRDLHVKSWWAA